MKYDIKTFNKKSLKFDDELHSKVYIATYIGSDTTTHSKIVNVLDKDHDWFQEDYYNSFQSERKDMEVKYKKHEHIFLLENRVTKSTSRFVGSLIKLLIFLHNNDLQHFYDEDIRRNVNYVQSY